MTDGDSGVLFTWSLTNEASCSYQALINRESVQTGCSDPTWDVKVFSSATGATTSVGHLLPAPVLQAQDGTFVGNAINTDDWTTVNIAGFNADGSVKWPGPPNYQSLFTTSDGGGVAETDSGQFVTFDQSGSITGQLPGMPVLSWKGAYQVSSSSLASVVPPDFVLATSLAAARGPVSAIPVDFLENGLDPSPSGNLTGNTASMIHHSFALFWCGNGFASQGYVPGTPCIQGDGDDIAWGYYRKAVSYCAPPSDCGHDALKVFFPDHPDWVKIIEGEALNSYKAAFAKFPIQISLARAVPQSDYTIFVIGYFPFDAAGKYFSDTTSWANYFAAMEGAEEALGRPGGTNETAWVDFLPTYPPTNATDFVSIMRALGKGLGNSAAHEIGHHLERVRVQSNGDTQFPYMNCGLANTNDPDRPQPIACEDDDNFVYGFFNEDGTPQDPAHPENSGGGMFFYGVMGGTPGVPAQSPIHWSRSQICWLKNYTAPGSCVIH